MEKPQLNIAVLAASSHDDTAADVLEVTKQRLELPEIERAWSVFFVRHLGAGFSEPSNCNCRFSSEELISVQTAQKDLQQDKTRQFLTSYLCPSAHAGGDYKVATVLPAELSSLKFSLVSPSGKMMAIGRLLCYATV